MYQNIPGRSDGKESDPNTGDPVLIPGSGRSPGEGNGCTPFSSLQYSTPPLLPREFHGQRSLVGYSGWDHRELDTTEQLTHRKLLTHNFKKFLPGSALVFSF